MLPRFASNTSKYTPGHEHQEIPSGLLSLMQLCGFWGWHVQLWSANAAVQNLQDTTNMLIIADERFVNIQVLIGSELKDWTRIEALPGASNSFTSADVHCQVKFLEYHEMGYGFTSIKRHGFRLTRRLAEKGIPSVAQVQCARLPGSRHLFMVLRVKEEAFGTFGSYSRTVG